MGEVVSHLVIFNYTLIALFFTDLRSKPVPRQSGGPQLNKSQKAFNGGNTFR